MPCGVIPQCPECRGFLLLEPESRGHKEGCSRWGTLPDPNGTVERAPTYDELAAMLEQVRSFANMPDADPADGFDPQFIAGEAAARRGLRAIPGMGE